ncbi:PREDICTED: uncharacterized protein LOC109207863 [Nicotiana attenuata]|uniref:uncharacterized protein LOC109207863 n=1 Tax=Nicotiana attenuata TaxID=49451 RepID=UPI0009059A20|nr:PREDICTED: uncharacterized protein LOC109207863 [Nicotiana attenuata]
MRATDKPCVITVIYGYNTCEQRKNIWETLKELAQGINMPWLIVGDFNAVLYPQDRLFGNQVQYVEIKDFTECIHDLLLNEVKWTGEYYTCTNKQQSNDRICSRLDRAFGNHDWMMEWGHIIMEYDVLLISDHAPTLFTLIPRLTTWKMRNIWLKLKALKPLFKQLNNEEFKTITHRVDKARNDLVAIQKQLNSQWSKNLMEQERSNLLNLEKWSMIEESIMKQKSRVK